jgi:hypothetical protein
VSRSRLLVVLLTFAVGLTLPDLAGATVVRLGAEVEEPSECVEPRNRAPASSHCQVFPGTPLRIAAVASRDDGSVRLAEQPFSLLQIAPRRPDPVLSFTYFDDDEADDEPTVVPRRNTDYQLRFLGNEDIGPAESAPLVVFVGARLTIPDEATRGRGERIRVPARVSLPWRSLRGRLELRRCHRAKATSAASCARRRDYTVLATRDLTESGQRRFPIAAPARSLRRYEIAFVPRSRAFTSTRVAFEVLNGIDGMTSYRPIVRASPFGDR